ncbi:NAD(P)/FAD-dependent oxidoreductase [Halalkalibacter kiskunsagensis]|uniref:NAD(P)/FAD-dependent oxidoreductase n=1 Tax=Halalkalibacter kiskunsagensis TaxID=1548599 RepID=A0ABV6KAS3_9BACI
MKPIDVIIIGGGPAGISAAIWCKRLGINHLLLEKQEQLGGQLFEIKNEIIDYPGVIAKDGKELQEFFVRHFKDIGCSYKQNAEVLAVNSTLKTIEVKCGNNIEQYPFQYIILATGAGPAYLDVPGEKAMITRGEMYSATTDAYLFRNKNVVIVGGGDRAFEGAILLAKAEANVYLIHRSTQFKAREEYIDEAKKIHNIKIITNAQVTRIHGEQKVTAVDYVNHKGKMCTLPSDAVFIRIGIKPNNTLIKQIVKTNEKGLIVTDSFGKTGTSFIYAIGDICTNPLFSSISSSVGQGMIVAKNLSLFLKGQYEGLREL